MKMTASIQYRSFEWTVRGTYDPSKTAAVFVEGAANMQGLGGRTAETFHPDVPARPSTYQWLDALFPETMSLPATFPAERYLPLDEEDKHAWFRLRTHGIVRKWRCFPTPLLIVQLEDGTYRYVVEENRPGNARSEEWRRVLGELGLFAIAALIESVPWSETLGA